MEETKKCTKCGEIKSINEFYKDKAKKDGYRADCKLCNSQNCKIYYKNNSTTIKQRAAQWSKNNPQRANEKMKQWKDKHRDKVRAEGRGYYHNNKDKYKRYSELNRENINAWNRTQVINLADRYIKNNLIKLGWGKENVTEEIIKEKRNIIKTKRIIRKINQSINQKTKTL